MTYVLLVLAIALVVSGVVFSVLPPLPGPLLAYLGLLCAHFSDISTRFSSFSIIIWSVLVLAVLVADYTLPVMAVRQFGGTRAGILGGLIGTAAVVLPIPFAIIIGPLLGAIIGDLIGGNRFRVALKSGFGSFLAFLIGTSLKVFISCGIGVAVLLKAGEYVFDAFPLS